MTSASAAVNGIRIAYDDEGAGEPLVLVHGHPFDRSLWEPQVREFGHRGSGGRRVVVPDLRGYGESTVVPGVTPLSTFARDIAALLDHLGLPRVTIGGVSMGGQVALEFRRLFPERVRAMVLSDTSPRADSEAAARQREELAGRLLREGLKSWTDEVLSRMITPYNVESQPEVAAHVRRMMYAAPPEGVAAGLRGRARRPDHVGLLPDLGVPTLVVVGRDDTFTPLAEAQFIHEQVPGSVLHVVEGAAHLPGLEQPAAFNGALRRFLSRLPG